MIDFDYSDMTPRDIEMYAMGIRDLCVMLGAEGSGKGYDPLTFRLDGEDGEPEDKTVHSYFFNLWDGGRHHKYESLEQIRTWLIRDAIIEVLIAARNDFKAMYDPDNQDKWGTPRRVSVMPGRMKQIWALVERGRWMTQTMIESEAVNPNPGYLKWRNVAMAMKEDESHPL